MIGSMLFVGDMPAGTYAAGDRIPMVLKDGPAVVRPGLGAPVLQGITTGAILKRSTTQFPGLFHIKNDNWVDEIINAPCALEDTTALSGDSTGYQAGCGCVLQENSGFTVYAEVNQAITTTVANSLFVLIDIDYPAVGAIADPEKEIGTPCSIEYDLAVTINATGAAVAALWDVQSFDKFKAGSRYLMTKIQPVIDAGTAHGFVAFEGGASMNGLVRIIPTTTLSSAIGRTIHYATVEQKGPVNVKAMFFEPTAGTANIDVVADYCKRS